MRVPALRHRRQVLSIYDWPVLPTRAELRRIPLRSLLGAPKLLARLAGGLAAPMVQFAGLLQALPRNFAYGLKALIDQKEAA